MAYEFCHVEIASTDLARSRDFLRELFGWKFTEFSPRYWVFSAGDGPGGGLALSDKEPVEGAIAVYVDVGSVEAALPRAQGLGATVTVPLAVIGEGYGHMAMIRIPGGAVLGLWSKAR